MPDLKRSPMQINPHRSPMDIHSDLFPEASGPLPEDTGVDEIPEDERTAESTESDGAVSIEPPIEKKKRGQAPARKKKP